MFTTDYEDKPAIIQAAQICGARLVQGLFPRWLVNKYDNEGKVEVDYKHFSRIYVVSVTDGQETQTLDIDTKVADDWRQ